MATCEIEPTTVLESEPPRATFWWRGLWPASVVVLAFLPMLTWHGRELWGRSHYQFFPLLIPCIAALMARFSLHLGPLEPGAKKRGNVLAVLTWLILAASVVLATPRLAQIALIMAMPATAYALGGRILVRSTLPAWCLLWLAVPPPYRLDFRVVELLQDLVSRWSSDLLDVLGVFHRMSGHVVDVSGRQLLVDQACSGIYSLFTLVTATLVYAFWVRCSVVRGVVLLAATVFWVVAGNVVRIVTVVALYKKTGIDTASGWSHEILGIVVFFLMMAMVYSTDGLVSAVFRFLRILISPFSPRGRLPAGQTLTPDRAKDELGSTSEPPQTVLAPADRTWLGSPSTALAFGLLLGLQFAIPGVSLRDILSTNTLYDKAFEPLAVDDLPARVGPFERTGFKTELRDDTNSLGEHSRIWSYRKAGNLLSVSLDYKFVDWHDLDVCYTGQGWKRTGRRVETLTANGASPERTVVIADYVDLEGHHGHLVFGIFDRDGQTVKIPWLRHWYVSGLIDQLTSWVRRSPARDPLYIDYQLQTFTQSETPVTKAEHQEILGVFELACERIHRRLLQVGGGSK